jgi:hypothetical protein
MLGGKVQIVKLVLYYSLTAVNVFLAVVKFLQSPLRPHLSYMIPLIVLMLR